MNDEKFTQKSQEAIQMAQQTALRYSHQNVDAPHLLLALLEQEDGLVPRILEKTGVNSASVKTDVGNLLDRLPRVSGQAVEAGKIYVSQEFQTLLVKAGDQAKRLKDEYISVEHLLLAMLEGGKRSETAELLRKSGLDTASVLNALKSVRGNQRVTSEIGRASCRERV